ncbi:hypothetical protein NMY22_g490 [Coprinellus aureogranulatus]|nr:hypothetical protein NMY22_g490 [Coprinellus aureogranulatus]
MLLNAAVDSVQDLTFEKGLLKLYGAAPVGPNRSHPVEVYVDGSCLNNGRQNARAGSGGWWGDNNPHNFAVRVPDAQTNNRGEVFAIFQALKVAHKQRALTIYSDSEYALHSILTYGHANNVRGWDVTNGDLFRDITTLLSQREGRVHFVQVRGHVGNVSHDHADVLAKSGAALPAVPPHVQLAQPQPGASVLSWTHPSSADLEPKVSFTPLQRAPNLPAQEDVPEAVSDSGSETDDDWYDSDFDVITGGRLRAHRGRGKVRRQKKELKRRLLEAKTEVQFWRAVKRIMNSKRSAAAISARQLMKVFKKRMNPIAPAPASFNLPHLSLHDKAAAAIPARTLDTTNAQHFSKPVTEDEVAAMKSLLHARSAERTSDGLDCIGYSEMMAMDNDVVAELFNKCLDDLVIPTAWLTTVLTAIPKKNKPKDDPESYRSIALESCGLKMLTLLIHLRLTAWSEEEGILPNSQNGFRAGYRTNNNGFVLRCAIERARANGQTLYVAFADITNAFPSTHHGCLWSKLRDLGAGGKIFDWLRLLYRSMEYKVHHADEWSESFRSLVGILIGDTSSPTLWALYMSDLRMARHSDDCILAGIPISNMEQADDIVLISTTPEGLQQKMDELWRWCNLNNMILNAIKSSISVYGPLPKELRPFNFGDGVVSISAEQTYVGLTTSSTERNIFAPHYSKKASKARTVGNTILGLDDMVGSLSAWDARKLYMALVDPHLIHGCEVMPDINGALLQSLKGVQNAFSRRALGLHSRSSLNALWTELGLMPIEYRRVILVLGYYRYLLSLEPNHFARLALTDSLDLLLSGKACWVGDLMHAMNNLPTPIALPDPPSLTRDAIDGVIQNITTRMEVHLLRETNTAPGLYLLHGRVEPQERGKPPTPVAYRFRHYLNVPRKKHRQALTRLLTSTHSLAVERLKWVRPAVAHEDRLCKFCNVSVETPEHALLVCNGHEKLMEIRRIAWNHIVSHAPQHHLLPQDPTEITSPVDTFRHVLHQRSTVRILAKLAWDVLTLYENESC